MLIKPYEPQNDDSGNLPFTKLESSEFEAVHNRDVMVNGSINPISFERGVQAKCLMGRKTFYNRLVDTLADKRNSDKSNCSEYTVIPLI